MKISALSREYLRYWVKARVAGNDYDPTADVLEFSVVAVGATPSSFQTGTWETADGSHFALCLIGPGTSTVLTPGEYDVYLKISDTPEVPVRKVDRLTVT